MRAKTFMQVSIGILALALAYHCGASNAQGQVAGAQVVGVGGAGGDNAPIFLVVNANGDTYRSGGSVSNWQFFGNAFSGPTPVQQTTFGALKAKYR